MGVISKATGAIKNRGERDLRFEVLRIIAMVIIVASHAAWHLSWVLHNYSGMDTAANIPVAMYYTIGQMGQVGVAIFFMITGYFMCKKPFKLSRIVKTVMQVFIYSMTIFAVVLLVRQSSSLPAYTEKMFESGTILLTILHSVLPILTNSYWFITAYVVLMFLAPLFNKLIDNLSRTAMRYLIIVLIMLCLWMVYGNFASLFGSVEYASLCYLLGAWIRRFGFGWRATLPVKRIMLCLISSVVAMTAFNYIALCNTSLGNTLNWMNLIQFGGGLRILSILVAFMLVMLFAVHVNPRMFAKNHFAKRLTLALVSTTFGVYLLHDNPLVMQYVWDVASNIPLNTNGLWRIGSFATVVAGVYLLSSALAYIFDRVVAVRIANRMANCNVVKHWDDRLQKMLR